MTRPPASRRERLWRGALLPIVLIAAAEIAARAVDLRSDSLASPSAILAAGLQTLIDGSVFRITAQTLGAALGGLTIGATLGLAGGIVLGLYQSLDCLLEFSIEVIRPIPSVALIPIAMLVFGFGYSMEISVVAFSVVWPMLILTRAAVAGIEPSLLEVASALRLSFPAKVGKIILLAALPRIFVAFRLCTGIALIVAVTVEIAANPLGLGYNMMVAQQSLHPALMFALLVWLALIGWSLNSFMIWLQLRLFGRYYEQEERR